MGPPALCHVDLVTDQKVVFLIIIDVHPIDLAHTVVKLPLLHDVPRPGFVHGPPIIDINLLLLEVALKGSGLLSSTRLASRYRFFEQVYLFGICFKFFLLDICYVYLQRVHILMTVNVPHVITPLAGQLYSLLVNAVVPLLREAGRFRDRRP